MKAQIELKGFTPILDKLVDQYGLVTAAIYGAVWRYAQQEDGECYASLQKIADRVGVSRKTAERHIKDLCEGGYLVDLTPDLKHTSHHYAYTGKAAISGTIEPEIIGETESLTSEDRLGRTESPTRSDRESYLGQTESLTKKQVKKQQERGDKSPAPQQPDNQQPKNEIDWWFENGEEKTDAEDSSLRQVEEIWIKKRIAHNTKLAIVAYYLAMKESYPDLHLPRDKTTQGKWVAGVKDHLANYSLEDLKRLYPLAIQHAKERGWDIYTPLSLTSALSKVNSYSQQTVKTSNYKDDPQYQFFAEIDMEEQNGRSSKIS